MADATSYVQIYTQPYSDTKGKKNLATTAAT